MISTRTKLGLVVFGVLWFFLMIYVMTILNPPKKNEQPSLSNSHLQEFDTESVNLNKDNLNFLPKIILKSNDLPDYRAISNSTLKQLSYNLVERKEKKSFLRPTASDVTNFKGIEVVLSGDESSIMGVIAAINSIHSNTRLSLHFYVSLPKKLIPYFHNWMSKSHKLNKVKYTVRPHPSSIPEKKPHFAKLFLLDMFPELQELFIYLDSDIIVQGDLSEMLNLPFKQGQVAIVSNDCNPVQKHTSIRHPYYSSHLNMSHESIKNLHINPKSCTFNTDVFVANSTEWRKKNIPNILHKLMKIHKKIPSINGVEPGCDEAEAAVLIAFYDHIGFLPALWHVEQLGEKPTSSYSSQFISKAKLLHWNGRFKPWGRRAPFSNIWQKYYVLDPENRYKPRSLRRLD